ncbi:MAG TPA: ATP synthase F0 subunit B [Candidatus Angelobacter sp.]|nr:ATP synthase F0 subunit B [Candidatus Angelobacter sp.]
MGDILGKLGELLLSSIPAIFCLLIVWAAYRSIVYTRLQQVLAERQALTEGAIERAREEIAAAEERTSEYERRVREARAQIFQVQEAHSRRTMEERNNALAEAREKADAMIKSARAALEEEVLSAKSSLEKQTDSLADEIIDIVLRPVAVGGS